jgi:hypothetical protein
MGIAPFVAHDKLPKRSSKLPNLDGAKLPHLRLSTAERLRRLEEAIAFLQHHLAAGSQPAKTLLQAAKTVGIAERTLHRAKDILGVTTQHTGWHGGWIWVPPASVSVPQAATVKRSWQLGRSR